LTEVFASTVSILTALGLGGVLGAYFQARFQHRTQIGQLEHELKQKRYLCIMILMLTKLNPQVGLAKTRDIRPDLKSADDVDRELETELLNAYIFASDEVLEALAAFIRRPSRESFARAAAAMRRDLWGRRTTISEEVLELVGSIGKQS